MLPVSALKKIILDYAFAAFINTYSESQWDFK